MVHYPRRIFLRMKNKFLIRKHKGQKALRIHFTNVKKKKSMQNSISNDLEEEVNQDIVK
jgi:hypothetical protein